MFQLETNNFGDAWCGGITWFFLVLISAKLTIDSRTSLSPEKFFSWDMLSQVLERATLPETNRKYLKMDGCY